MLLGPTTLLLVACGGGPALGESRGAIGTVVAPMPPNEAESGVAAERQTAGDSQPRQENPGRTVGTAASSDPAEGDLDARADRYESHPMDGSASSVGEDQQGPRPYDNGAALATLEILTVEIGSRVQGTEEEEQAEAVTAALGIEARAGRCPWTPAPTISASRRSEFQSCSQHCWEAPFTRRRTPSRPGSRNS